MRGDRTTPVPCDGPARGGGRFAGARRSALVYVIRYRPGGRDAPYSRCEAPSIPSRCTPCCFATSCSLATSSTASGRSSGRSCMHARSSALSGAPTRSETDGRHIIGSYQIWKVSQVHWRRLERKLADIESGCAVHSSRCSTEPKAKMSTGAPYLWGDGAVVSTKMSTGAP